MSKAAAYHAEQRELTPKRDKYLNREIGQKGGVDYRRHISKEGDYIKLIQLEHFWKVADCSKCIEKLDSFFCCDKSVHISSQEKIR